MAELDEGCKVFYCVVCGPCLKLLGGEDQNDVIVHLDVPHPLDFLFPYEETLQ